MPDTATTAPARSKTKSKRKRKATAKPLPPVRFSLDTINITVCERPEGRGVLPKLHPKQQQVLETGSSDTRAVSFSLDLRADPKLFIREFRRGLRKHQKGVKMFSAIRPGNVVLLWVGKSVTADPVGPSGNGAAGDEPEDRPDRVAREADLRDADAVGNA